MIAAEDTTLRPTAAPDSGRRRGLGRGLSALLGDEDPVRETASETAGEQGNGQPKMVPVEKLHPSRFQPRRNFDAEQIENLAQSIRENGVLQPLIVRPHHDISDNYEIVAGERRWRAAQKAQLHEVPIIIRSLNDDTTLEVALIENVQRQDLAPLEEAEGYRRLIDQFSYTQEALAKKIGKSRVHIANMLRLLSLPDSIKAMLRDGALTAGHARALIGRDDAEALAQEIVSRGLTVRQAEKLAQGQRDESPAKGRKNGAKKAGAEGISATPIGKDADTVALENDLSHRLGLKVEIHGGEAGGQVVIHYQSLEQLDDLLHRFG